jgi:hypothetical protein
MFARVVAGRSVISRAWLRIPVFGVGLVAVSDK